MDDRYDDFGDKAASKCGELPKGTLDNAANRKVARSASAQKGQLTAALMRTRREISRLVDRVCQRFFAPAGFRTHFKVIGEVAWDNTLLCWLVEGKLFLQEEDYTFPPDLAITGYSFGKCVLTVRISRDRNRDLCVFHESEKFSREIEGIKVMMAYFYEHFKDLEYGEVDPVAALKKVEMWLRTPMVESHLRRITEQFVPVPGSMIESDS